MSYRSIIRDLKSDRIIPYKKYKRQQKEKREKQARESRQWSERYLRDAKDNLIDDLEKEVQNAQRDFRDFSKHFDRDIGEIQNVKRQYLDAGYPEDSHQVKRIEGKIDWFEEQKELKINRPRRTIEHGEATLERYRDMSDARILKEAGTSDKLIAEILGNLGLSEDEINKEIGTSRKPKKMSARERRQHEATLEAAGPAPTPSHLPSEQEPQYKDTGDMPTRSYEGSDITDNPRFARVEGTPSAPEQQVVDTQTEQTQADTQTTPQGTETPAETSTGTTGTTTPETGTEGTTGQTTPSGDVVQTEGMAGQSEALATIDADPRIPEDLKPMFKRVVKGWNPNQQLNLENVLSTFNEIKTKTIDPYFEEQIQQFTNDLESTVDYRQKQQALTNEQMETQAGERVRSARQGLEASGRTFSGEGVRQLGEKSAYARPDQRKNVKTPLQTPFAGGKYAEGLVPQQNRLMSTSTRLKQKKAMEDLARQAEKTLGSEGAKELEADAWGRVVGDVTQGTMGAEKQKAQASALEGVYNQQQSLNQYNKPIEIFK